jgi:hypothetical protein
VIRPLKAEDRDFFFDSWLKSWRKSRYAGVIPNNLYYDTYRSTIESLVARGATVQVACGEENPDHILGWVCWEKTPDGYAVVHYLYVKDPYLKYQVDEKLLAGVEGERPGFYTFKYPQVERALEKAGGRWTWAPEIARRK